MHLDTFTVVRVGEAVGERMEDHWYPITDVEGRRGSVRSLSADAERMEVRFDDGEALIVPRSQIRQTADGAYRFERAFAALLEGARTGAVVFPVVEEEIAIAKRTVERERVRVSTHVSVREELVDVPLVQEEINVVRVPVGRVVEAMEGPREEGDTLIFPVYDEVLVVEKRLVLREEVRLKKSRREQHEEQRVSLRREEVQIDRTSAPRER